MIICIMGCFKVKRWFYRNSASQRFRRQSLLYGVVALRLPRHIRIRKQPQRCILSYLFYLQQMLRQTTSSLRGLPDFVIIGAQKSGTTSLYNFIIKHPTIAPASRKELHYFSIYYDLGERWYRSNFPTNLSRRRHYKKTGQKLLSGEASPTYFFFPRVSGRMKKDLPDAKLIVILRNPVDRAYSQYQHTLSHNNETLSFEKAIELEEKRCAGEREQMIKDPGFVPKHFRKHSYLARGTYADQLERWFKHYDRKQFLILATEDLRKNPQRTLDQIFNFLEVPPFQIGDFMDANTRIYEKMSKDTRKFLVEYFKPHNERLYRMLQRSFDWDK